MESKNTEALKTNLYVILANFVVSILQTAFFLEIIGAKSNPNLIFSLSFALYLTWGLELSLLSAIVGGFFLDLVSFNIIGFTPVLLILFIYVSYFIKKRVQTGLYLQVILFGLFYLIYEYVVGSVEQFVGADSFLGLLGTLLFFLVFYWSATSLLERRVKAGLKIPYGGV
jgi:cell shape-determining protein MreD